MIQNGIQYRTDQKHGFAGNAEEEKNLNDAVAKFAQASVADRSDFKQLTDTNTYQKQQISLVSSNNDELQQHILALQNHMNMMNLVQKPAIPTVQSQHTPTTVQPPQYPQYPQPPPKVNQPPPVHYKSPQQVPYRKPYVQRGGYQGRGREHYLPRGDTQGHYQQQVKYVGPTQKYGGHSLQPYQALRHQYGQNRNDQGQGFQGPYENVKR